jgi:3-deoxy-D-manno-octulosonic-acid transferase
MESNVRLNDVRWPVMAARLVRGHRSRNVIFPDPAPRPPAEIYKSAFHACRFSIRLHEAELVVQVRTFYNIIFTLGFVVSSPYFFWRMRRRGGWQAGFAQRFGGYDSKFKQAITNRHTLWLHAVSVGEVNLCTQLIRALELRLPNIKFVVSTTTTTGMQELRRKLPGHVSKIYYPVDTRGSVRRALQTISPRAVVLVEAEIWPNFLWRALDRGTPVFLVNARLSERSYRGYKRLRLLFRRLFGSFAGVGAQTEADAERLVTLGCRPEAVRVVGSLKYDAAELDERRSTDIPGLLEKLGVRPEDLVLLGGSTHPGEEQILARVYLKLRQRFPSLFLILVPRHFERSRDVGRQLEGLGVRFVYRKDVAGSTPWKEERPDCLLVNTTGELRHFYRQATVVFVGKSLAAHGGQNPIEPGALGKALVIGPNMENFADITRSFLQAGGAIQVPDEAGLEKAVAELLADERKREDVGSRALAVVRENLGAVNRTVDMIVEHLDGGEVYVARRQDGTADSTV